MDKNKLDLLGTLIRDSKHIVALTGAGISTSAGIPDFRGPDGLYSRKEIPVNDLFDIDYFRHDPNLFYSNIGDFWDLCLKADPTPAHAFLKKLEDTGKLKLLVTQNIDGLHRKAGSVNLIEIHGNFNNFYCVKCRSGRVYDYELESRILSGRIPICSECGGTLKPSVVFFGEGVIGFDDAVIEAQKCDLFLSIGSSMVVNPAAAIADYISAKTALVIINKGDTPYDNRADLKIEEDIDNAAKYLEELLGL